MRLRVLLATAAAVVLWPFASRLAAQASVPHDSLALGGRVIAAGATERGPIVVAGGDLVVRGTVQGTVVAVAGDIVVEQGGRITGDAIAAFGDIRNGGAIDGTPRALTGTFGASMRQLLQGPPSEAKPRAPLTLAAGWFGVMILIGLGVLVFASPYLDGVVDVLGQSFWRSFVTGILGELGVLPVILLVCVALAITVIGALLIPFAVVAIVLGVAGLATLGFVAVARLTGDGLGGRSTDKLGSRGSALRGVVVGLTVYMGLWLLAAAISGPSPTGGTVLRVLALLATFVAATTGFGAALLSRGGTRRDAAVVAPAPASDAGWQTPTPVSGVVAARRPRPRAESGSGR